MRELGFLIVVILPAVSFAGQGLATVAAGNYLGKTKTEIATSLENQGYVVEEFERERGLIEVEANIGGVSYEIHVDPKNGEIVDIEEDD